MGKDILYLSNSLPYPTVGGDRLRIYNILKQLKLNGHRITLVSLVTPEDDLQGCLQDGSFFDRLIPIKFNKKLAYVNAANAIFNDKPFIVEYFYSREMQNMVDALIKNEHFDIISGYMIRVAPYFEKHKNKMIILDFVDAVSMMYERRIKTVKSLWDKLKIGIEYLKVRNYERKCAKLFSIQTVISEVDKSYLQKYCIKSNIKIIGNGVDTDYFYPQKTKLNNTICFVGSMQYIPNSEAAIYFSTKVFPLIKKEIPDAKFKIIGANPRKDLLETVKGIEGVEVTGKVDDVREYMKDCKVSVCPVKIAGGIQNKILEAMSMGIPVVTTPEGAEGLCATEDILQVATFNDDFAKKVVNIMKNDVLQKEISIKSRKFTLSNFSWVRCIDSWNELILEVDNG